MCHSSSPDLPVGTTTEVLYRSPSGALSFCAACRTFGLTFGCVHVGLDAEALLAFAQLLDRMSSVRLKAGQCHMIRLGCSPASLLLEPTELVELRHILLQGQQLAVGARAAATAAASAPAPEAWVN